MSRHDSGGPTRLYIGRISSRTRAGDLEDLFAKYGRVRDVDVKHDFAFVEYSDNRDAEDAVYHLDGVKFDGARIAVEFARPLRSRAPGGGGGRDAGGGGGGGSREYGSRGPAPGSGRCYNCGKDGHWARDCKAGDWRDKCYRCGRNGHIERSCRYSPRPEYLRERERERARGGRSSSRSPQRKSYSRSASRSRSRSLSPVKRRRSVEGEEERPSRRREDRSPRRDGDEERRPRRDDDEPPRSRDVDDLPPRGDEDDELPPRKREEEEEPEVQERDGDRKHREEDEEAPIRGDDGDDDDVPPPRDVGGDDDVDERKVEE